MLLVFCFYNILQLSCKIKCFYAYLYALTALVKVRERSFWFHIKVNSDLKHEKRHVYFSELLLNCN